MIIVLIQQNVAVTFYLESFVFILLVNFLMTNTNIVMYVKKCVTVQIVNKFYK